MDEEPDYHYDYDTDSVVDSAGNPPPEPPPVDEDRFLASMARFMIEGDEREEARLLLACELEAWEDSAVIKGMGFAPTLFLRLSGPRRAYDLLSDNSTMAFEAFFGAANALRPAAFAAVRVLASASMVGLESADWRNELLAVLDGRSVDNQAIGFKATKSYEGLRFRSESEVRVAQALDRAGVLYLPNCKARVGSKDRRRNSEADFLVCADGKWGVLEVDGGQWHPPKRAAQDHQRDRPFKHHGAVVVERYDAGECFENPDGVVREFLRLLKAH